MLLPFNETLQKQYRDTLATVAAPTQIDTDAPVVPVAVIAQVNTSSSAGYNRITDGTDTALVTTAGELIVQNKGFPTLSSTQTFKQWRVAAVAVTTAYTVPASKKVTVTGLAYGNGSGAVARGVLYATDGTTELSELSSSANYESAAFGGFPIAVYAAGEAVKASSGHASARIFIYAIEEDA